MEKKILIGLFFALILAATISTVNAELLTSPSINVTVFPNAFGGGMLAGMRGASAMFNATVIMTPGGILSSSERNVTVGFVLFPPITVEHPIPQAAVAAVAGGAAGASSGGGGAGVSGTQASTLSTVATNVPSSVAFTANPSQVSNVEFTLSEPAINVKIIVAEVTALSVPPVTNSVPSTDKVYKNIQIELRNVRSVAIKEAKIQFSVDKSWLAENNIAKDTVTLYRYENGWHALATKSVSEETGVVRYVATTPGFSTFAIVGKPSAQAIAVDEKTQEAVQQLIADTGQPKSLSAFPAVPIGLQTAAAVSIVLVIVGIVLMQVIRPKKRRR